MTTTQENAEESFDVNRFVGGVSNTLICSICGEVPKDPRLCKNNNHIFCLPHISQHLKHFQTCPNCRDQLTPEALRRPTESLKKELDDLKIKCDHHDRGCIDVVRLEDLPQHVDQCDFAPFICGNEGCGMVINKSEKENHEKNICKFRIAMCHDCEEIKASQDKWKDEMKVELSEMKHEIAGMERKQDQMQQSVDEMKGQFHTMMTMVNQALQGSNVNNIGAQAADPRVSANIQDI